MAKSDIAFTIIIGSLFIFAVDSSLLMSTIIEVSPVRLYLTGLLFLLLFMCVLYNRITMLAALAAVLIAAFFIWRTWDSWAEQNEFLQELIMLARGLVVYDEKYAGIAVTGICAASGLFVALFMFKRFSFILLTLGGSSTFMLSWLMDYRREDSAFILFLFCFCMLVIKMMNHKKRADASSFSALLALPVCALAVYAASFAPGITTGAGNPMQTLLDAPLSAVGEFFYLAFNPKYFSFQSTGFSNARNELGGSVNLNDRDIMRVAAPERIYLAGATKDSYTGRAWENTVQTEIPTAGLHQGRFELLETAAALIKRSNVYESPDGDGMTAMEILLARYPELDANSIHIEDLPLFSFNREVFMVGMRRGRNRIAFFDSFEDREQAETAADLIAQYFQIEEDRMIVRPGLDRGFYRSYLPVDVVTVNVVSRTGSVFRPSKAWEPDILPQTVTEEVTFLSSPAGDWYTENLLETAAAYSFKYLSPDTDLSFVRDALNGSYRGYYRDNAGQTEAASGNEAQVFNSLYETYEYNTIPGLSLDSSQTDDDFSMAVNGMNNPLADYADEVYARYLGLPENLPVRVRELAAELTANSETDYQKVKAIEEYLLSFPYTLTPGAVPDGADFVDYFLFEGREGYCTYYASAMAVLSRCAGIPSRFVEGYILPSKRDADNFFTVTNKNAHSWTEVYLEGYGWLTLEPTAPYHSVMSEPETETPVPSGMFSDDYMNSSDYMDYLYDMGFTPSAVAAPPAAAAKPQKDLYKEVLIYMGIILSALAVSVSIFIIIQRLREAHRFKAVSRLTANKQAEAYFLALIKMTDYFLTGYYLYPKRREETSQMYCQRLGRRFAFKSDTVFLPDLIKLYYKARYGENSVSEKELALLRDCYFEFVRFLRGIKLRYAFMYMRYVRRLTVL